MGTVAGVNTRRYHALLIASLNPPADRVSLVARVEETVSVGGKRFALASAQYPGVVAPHGHDLLDEFRLDPFPHWRYNLDGVIVQKTVCLLDKRQAVLLCYRLPSLPAKRAAASLLSRLPFIGTSKCRAFH